MEEKRYSSSLLGLQTQREGLACEREVIYKNNPYPSHLEAHYQLQVVSYIFLPFNPTWL